MPVTHPPEAPFVRKLYPPSSAYKSEGGLDVVGVKRAASRLGVWPWQQFDEAYSQRFAVEAIGELRKRFKLPNGLVYDEALHEKVLHAHAVKPHAGEWAFDGVAAEYLRRAKRELEPPQLKIMRELYAYCSLFDGPYVWGGEHDATLRDDGVHGGYDCSSSTASVLDKFGLLGGMPAHEAHVAEWFKSWGEQGPGRYLTVHAASDHVWIELTVPGLPWARFDTSPKGDGEHGPRLRHGARDEARFVSRHPIGY